MKALWEKTPRQQVAYWVDQIAGLSQNAEDATAGIAETDDSARKARNAAIVEDAQAAIYECELALKKLDAVCKNGKWTLGPIDVRNFIAAIREHAIRHYEGGWDVVVEAMTDDEIADQIKWCESAEGAIRKLGRMVRDYAAYTAEIRATAC